MSNVLWTASVLPEMESIAGALRIGSCPGRPWELARAERVDLLLTGVGKANAAGAIASVLEPDRHTLIVNAGVAGTVSDALSPGDVLLASRSLYLDEGVRTPTGLIGIEQLGFAPGPGGRVSYEPPTALARAWADAGGRLGVIGTVSSGAGTDALRVERARAGALAEAMEGAAAMQAAAYRGVPGVELRAVSNTTGDRDSQSWDLASALDALRQGVLRLERVIGSCGL